MTKKADDGTCVHVCMDGCIHTCMPRIPLLYITQDEITNK